MCVCVVEVQVASLTELMVVCRAGKMLPILLLLHLASASPTGGSPSIIDSAPSACPT